MCVFLHISTSQIFAKESIVQRRKGIERNKTTEECSMSMLRGGTAWHYYLQIQPQCSDCWQQGVVSGSWASVVCGGAAAKLAVKGEREGDST